MDENERRARRACPRGPHGPHGPVGDARRARRRSKGRARCACLRGCNCSESRRSIFLTEGSTPRRGRRVLPVTLGHHHKPFGSARTARALRALDLAGALHALWRTERRGAREKRRRSRSANDMRLAPPACSEPAKRARMGTGPAQRQSCGPGGHVPHMHRILQEEIQWPELN